MRRLIHARTFTEQLEQRRLLSAAIVSRVLTIAGTVAPDIIEVIRLSGTNGQNTDVFQVTIDNDVESFSSLDVDQIVIDALGGSDTITLIRTLPATINGGDGNDTITGSSNAESFFGDAGHDSIVGGQGIDSLDGGAGSDFLSGGSGSDVILGGKGNDTLKGEGGNDILRGDGGTDLLEGGSGDDNMVGGIQSDTLNGHSGEDSVTGHDGTAGMSPASDVLSGGSGARDNVIYDRETAGISLTLDDVANDGVAGEADNVASDFEIFNGSNFDDLIDVSSRAGRLFLIGGSGNDTLIGGQGADAISGTDGNDSLTGGPGEDRLFGGVGDDTLVADDGVADILNGGIGTDTALEDSGLDTLLGVEL